MNLDLDSNLFLDRGLWIWIAMFLARKLSLWIAILFQRFLRGKPLITIWDRSATVSTGICRIINIILPFGLRTYILAWAFAQSTKIGRCFYPHLQHAISNLTTCSPYPFFHDETLLPIKMTLVFSAICLRSSRTHSRRREMSNPTEFALQALQSKYQSRLLIHFYCVSANRKIPVHKMELILCSAISAPDSPWFTL